MKHSLKKRILALCLTVFCLAFLALPFSVYAASGQAKILFSTLNVYLGNRVTVTVTYSSSTPMAVWNFSLQYDSAKVKYVSGADSSSGNKLNFVGYPQSGGVTSKSYTVTFEAIGLGSANFKTVTNEVYAENYSPITVSEANRSITVSERPAASSENRLSALSVEGGELSPAFAEGTTEYSLTVPYAVSSLKISAETKHSAARTSVTGADSLAVGANTVTVRVTAENGSSRTYTLSVTRTDSEFVGAEVSQTEATGTFLRDPVEVQDVPQGFSPVEGTYQQQKVLLFENAAKSVLLAALVREDAEGRVQTFYVYEKATETFFPYVVQETAPRSFVFLKKPSELSVPEGFSGTILLVNECEVDAWQNAEGAILVYAAPVDASAAFYVYQPETKLFELYAAPVETPLAPEEGTAPDQTVGAPVTETDDTNEVAFLKQIIFWGLIVALSLIFILLIVILILAIVSARRKRALLERGEERELPPAVDILSALQAQPSIAQELASDAEEETEEDALDAETADASDAAFVPPIPTEELLMEVQPDPEIVAFPEDEPAEAIEEATGEEAPLSETTDADAVVIATAEGDVVITPEILSEAAAEPLPELKAEKPMIWDELAREKEESPEEILAPSRTRKEVSSAPAVAEEQKEERRGHPTVERVFNGESTDEVFRRNNPLYDEDDETDAPVFGFDDEK